MSNKNKSSRSKLIIERQRKFFSMGGTRSIKFRKEQLRCLMGMIEEQELNIFEALKTDLNKSAFEAYETEIGLVKEEIRFFLKRLKKLSSPLKVKTPLTQFPSSSRVFHQSYGNVLIISPWNYPFMLTMIPLVGALAAGNTVIIKPSEYSSATSKMMGELLRACFKEDYVALIEGGVETGGELLEEKFDKIFFTGSPGVGKIVMQRAAKNLTPVTLELGGKSPCIVGESAKIDLTAKRIVWGKFINAGQTCVAPDYILAHKSVVGPLLESMKKYINEFYPNPIELDSGYPKIITPRHFNRLIAMIDEKLVFHGGQSDLSLQQIAPTILYPVNASHRVMEDEIFGPLLPVLEYTCLEEVFSFINERPSPLALYLFSENRNNKRQIMEGLSFGGGCINDTLVHMATPYMAFGGVGESGMGSYHGQASFETFSHKKSVMKRSSVIDIALRYPPHKNRLKRLKMILK